MTRAKLYWSVSAISMMLGLGAAPTPLSAQQNVPPGITVGSDDIAGVVTGPQGPEAGVGHRGDDRSADQIRGRSWSPTMAGATSFPIFRLPTNRFWCAATDWWIRRRSTASGPTSI